MNRIINNNGNNYGLNFRFIFSCDSPQFKFQKKVLSKLLNIYPSISKPYNITEQLPPFKIGKNKKIQ